MKELSGLLKKIGAENVKTYIQSGNVVLTHKEKDVKILSAEITGAVKKNYGFEPNVIFLKQKELEKIILSNPFTEGKENPKTVHVFFLESKPKKPNFKKMDEIKTETESYKLVDKAFYLYAPDGVGRSKLAAHAEKLLGVPATARNWRTVTKLLEMTKEV